jgi:uncharacterized membrane protein
MRKGVNWLCYAGFTGLAWFLVFFPIIFLFFFIAIVIIAMTKQSKNENHDDNHIEKQYTLQ